MRRFLVILLILLFPLNVLALSMSVSAAQPDGASVQPGAVVAAGGAFAGDANPDIDPDEPPTVAEPHDFMNLDGRLHLAGCGAAVLTPHGAPPCRLSLPPPDKPPRLA
jgi:hypothetical protein